jgi:hypothetical protein
MGCEVASCQRGNEQFRIPVIPGFDGEVQGGSDQKSRIRLVDEADGIIGRAPRTGILQFVVLAPEWEGGSA